MKSLLKTGIFVVCTFVTALMVAPGSVRAADHGGAMAEMGHGGGMGSHEGMKMGDKVYEGKLGGWKAEARLMDMKAHMGAMPSGMKMEGAMPNSHHLAVTVTDTKAMKTVTEGKGTVTVTGPGKKAVKSTLMAMQGHFGADVNLPAAGKYTFEVDIASGEGKGKASFTHTVK